MPQSGRVGPAAHGCVWMLLAPASLRVDVPEDHGVPCSRGGAPCSQLCRLPKHGDEGLPPPLQPPQPITMVWGGLPETISGWTGLLGGAGGHDEETGPDMQCSVVSGPQGGGPGLSITQQPQQARPGQPAAPATSTWPGTSASMLGSGGSRHCSCQGATSPAQHLHLGGVVTGGEAGEGPERRRWVGGPTRPDRRSQNGQRTRGRKGTGSERT